MIGLLRQAMVKCVAAVMYRMLPLLVRLATKRHEKLVWGLTPLINYRYWSQAMQEAGWRSETFVTHHYSISSREDFDRYLPDIIPGWCGSGPLRDALAPWFAFMYIVRHAKIYHTSFAGGPLGTTPYWRVEAQLLKRAGIRTVVFPYGGDAYAYARLDNHSYKHALLGSYPAPGREEPGIRQRIDYWSKHADAVLVGFMVEGMPRWDVTVNNTLVVDTRTWQRKTHYSDNDGRNGAVQVLHSPNHRGVKGTEFLCRAIDDLKNEGLQVELVLLERVPNTRVREVMQSVDILAEQFVALGYALNGIEGMASGLPVMANLEDARVMNLFRRYAFLNECPVVSTTIEDLKSTLRVLIQNPALREQLGVAGRQYVEKYHSFSMAQYMLGETYKVVLGEGDCDLMNLFHPLFSEFNRRLPRIEHPLTDNRVPPGYYA